MTRVPQLDILRALAVVLVICFHAKEAVFRFGWIGVDLFFVISGFLISGLLFDELSQARTISVGRFLLRRGLKIYPSFYFFLLIMLVGAPGHSYWREAVFIQNYSAWSIGHTWSLAVEEHFYLILPFVLLLLAKIGRLRWIPALAIGLLVVCFLLRLMALPMAGAVQTHLRIDALFFGVALRYLYDFQQDRIGKPNYLWLIFAFVMILPAVVLRGGSPVVITVGLTMLTVGFSTLLVWALSQPWLRCKPIEQIGQASYSIYLWQLIVIAMARNLGFVGQVVLCIAVGIAMAQIVEFPVLAIRDRFFPKERRPKIPVSLLARESTAIPS